MAASLRCVIMVSIRVAITLSNAIMLTNESEVSCSNTSKEKLILTRLNSSSVHPEPVYEGTPTDYCKDQAVFNEEAVPFLSGW